jgi:hypothetical protein
MREPNIRLWYGGLQLDCLDGQKGQSVLWWWCGGDGDSRGHHVASSRAGEADAPPAAQGCVALIGGVPENRMRWQRPVVNHYHEYGT